MYLGGSTPGFRSEALRYQQYALSALGDPHAGRPGIVGWHILADIENARFGVLSNVRELEEIVREAATKSNATLVKVWSHRFGPGASVVGLLSESHIAIHTWPEWNLATVDIYTCSKRMRHYGALEAIADALGGDIVNLIAEERGVRYELPEPANRA